MQRSCQFRVEVLYFAQVSTTFGVYSVTNFKSKHERIPEWMCFSEKVDQTWVLSFTIDQTSDITFKNDLFNST